MTEMPLASNVYYFGCNEQSGHYMFTASLRSADAFTYNNPWGTKVDGGLCPHGQEVQGRTAIHHKDGWTALAFWDRSVDARMGSCSVFLAKGTYDFTTMKEITEHFFPSIMKRFHFVLTA